MRRTWIGVALASVIAASITVIACNNGANDPAGCRQIEDERCARAPECGLDPGFPLHAGSSDQDFVTACQLFYYDACLHGFVTTATITSTELDNCTSAIHRGNCDAVINPQLLQECSWLNPVDAGVDAADDADATSTGATTTIIETTTATTAESDAGEDSGLASCYAGCNSTCEGDTACVSACEAQCQSG